MKFLTRQEELILLAIYRLKENAYLVTIREYLMEHTGKDWSIGAVYVPMDRMVRNDFLATHIGESNNTRRGRNAIKYYQLTEKGIGALNEIKKVHDAMWLKDGELKYGN